MINPNVPRLCFAFLQKYDQEPKMRICFERYEKIPQTPRRPSGINLEELVRQARMAFEIWRSGGEIDCIRMLELASTLGLFSEDDPRLQFWCGAVWELAERGAQPEVRSDLPQAEESADTETD